LSEQGDFTVEYTTVGGAKILIYPDSVTFQTEHGTTSVFFSDILMSQSKQQLADLVAWDAPPKTVLDLFHMAASLMQALAKPTISN
jgi:hypothetical protein